MFWKVFWKVSFMESGFIKIADEQLCENPSRFHANGLKRLLTLRIPGKHVRRISGQILHTVV